MDKNLINDIQDKIKTIRTDKFNIELKEVCDETIPKDNKLKNEIRAYTIGCYLYKKITGKKYNKNQELIKEVGIYQFLQATLQEDIASIISDEDYLIKLLKLYII